MDDHPFYNDARIEFGYLETEFGFGLFDKKGHWSSYDLNYEKNKIQVTISLEWYDKTLSIYLTRTDIDEKKKRVCGTSPP